MKTYKTKAKMVMHGVTAEFSILAASEQLAKQKLDWFLRVAVAHLPCFVAEASEGSVTFNISDHGSNLFADADELKQHYDEQFKKTRQYYAEKNKDFSGGK